MRTLPTHTHTHIQHYPSYHHSNWPSPIHTIRSHTKHFLLLLILVSHSTLHSSHTFIGKIYNSVIEIIMHLTSRCFASVNFACQVIIIFGLTLVFVEHCLLF